jgi:hypothetical protein
LALALPPLRPAAFFCCVVPPWLELLLLDDPEPDFSPPRLDDPSELGSGSVSIRYLAGSGQRRRRRLWRVAVERTPSRHERFWARRFVLIAVVLALIGVFVGGSASAYFFIAAMVCGLAAAFCLRGTIDGPGGG